MIIPTDRQRELVAAVAEVGPVFAERAARYDREASFPWDNWRDLADMGFLRLCIPERYGGLGAGFVDYALVAEELGRHCGATALTFNMHSATMLLCGPISDDLDFDDEERELLEARRRRMYADVVENGTIHSQPFSEGLGGRATSGIATTARPVEGGYVVNGRKIFASLSDAAGMHDIVCLVEGDPRVRFLGVPAGSEGLVIEGDWDPLGMRGTVSRNLRFHDVFVPAENEWLPPGAFDQAARRWPYFYMTLSFAYLGITRAAIDFTRSYLKGELDGSPRWDKPAKQAGWAQMLLRYEQAQALCYRVLSEAGRDPTPEQVQRAWASMVTTMETAPDVASLAIRVCGGRSLLRPYPLERIFRDARCGATMLPWSVEVCLERLGRSGLVDDDQPAA